jgi:two-component system cell cycle sensor histidine kinase/response regulator CckA
VTKRRSAKPARPRSKATPGDAERRRAAGLRAEEAHVLEMVAAGESLDKTLDSLAKLFEAQADGMLASILLVDEAGRMRHGAAPNLPEAWIRAIDGQPIGPDQGSCGSAAYRKEPVIVADIAIDPRWVDYREAALGFGLRACWAVPILGGEQQVLGTFALYYPEPRKPTPQLLELVTYASRLAAIAIQTHQHQEALRESETSARLILENALDANVLMNSAGVVTGWTARATALFGWTPEETLGRPLSSFIIPERMRQQHEAGLRHYLATGEGPILGRRLEISALHRDGHEFPVQLSVTPIRRGDQVIFSAFVEDITERKRMEDEVRQLQKLEAIGRLSGGIAHDFNNLLSVIVGVGNLLLPELEDPDQRYQVEEIVKAGERGAELTRQFLAFSRKQVLQPEVLDLNVVVGNLEPMLRRLIRADIALLTSPAGSLWRVEADRGQIEQVVVNLVVNARDAMPIGGTLRIETANAELPGDYPESHGGILTGQFVMLAVTDTGHGMDEATRKRLFEPFFTTKELGKGTGLGLATIYGIVKQSGGYIAVASAPGEGASFKVFLPRATDSIELTRTTPTEPGGRVATGPEELHVLLVEDEPALRRAIERMLRRLDFRVTVAAGGEEALEAITQRGLVPDLLLTDLVMPGMSGDVLAQRVRQILPSIGVLPMSGYVDDSIRQGLLLKPGSPFLQKPFTSMELAAGIHEAMGKAKPGL